MWFYLKQAPKLVSALALLSSAQATELTHHFENPNFGGNPLNGNFLLNQAEQQNKLKDPATSASNRPQPKSNLELFKDRLQQIILNRLTQNATTGLFDTDGKLVLGATFTFGDFSITVGAATDANHNVSITITDGITETILTVPYTSS
jgi:curli production assembly/transport component CsgF